MNKVNLEITSCKDCPFLKIGMSYSTDGWDRGEDWFCKKKDNKTIVTFVEHNDNPTIPDWCPIADPNSKKEEKPVKDREIIIDVRGNSASGKSTLVYLIKKMLLSHGLEVSFFADPDFSSNEVFESIMSKDTDKRINSIKKKTNISLRETMAHHIIKNK